MGRARVGQPVQVRFDAETLAWIDGQVELAGPGASRSSVVRAAMRALMVAKSGVSRPELPARVAAAPAAGVDRAEAFRRAQAR